MSKIAKRNFVKKNMDRLHRPTTHKPAIVYDRRKATKEIENELVSISERQESRR